MVSGRQIRPALAPSGVLRVVGRSSGAHTRTARVSRISTGIVELGCPGRRLVSPSVLRARTRSEYGLRGGPRRNPKDRCLLAWSRHFGIQSRCGPVHHRARRSGRPNEPRSLCRSLSAAPDERRRQPRRGAHRRGQRAAARSIFVFRSSYRRDLDRTSRHSDRVHLGRVHSQSRRAGSCPLERIGARTGFCGVRASHRHADLRARSSPAARDDARRRPQSHRAGVQSAIHSARVPGDLLRQ